MRCYICRGEVREAVRKWMAAKDRRYRDGFRDLCRSCYEQQMKTEGYREVHEGYWAKQDIPAQIAEKE